MKYSFPTKHTWLLLSFLFLTGCASVLKPGYYVHVPVTTDPPGATLSVNGYSAISPTTVWVPRGEGDFKLTITKKGYKPAYIFLRQSPDILFGWNIPLVGHFIDIQTGAAYANQNRFITR